MYTLKNSFDLVCAFNRSLFHQIATQTFYSLSREFYDSMSFNNKSSISLLLSSSLEVEVVFEDAQFTKYLVHWGMRFFSGAFSGAETMRISISVTVTFLVGIIHGNFRRRADDGAANINCTSCSACSTPYGNIGRSTSTDIETYFRVHH